VAKGGYQRRRIKDKKVQEREARKRAQRKRLLLTWLVGIVVLVLIGGLVLAAMKNDGEDLASSTSPSPTATKSGECTKAGPETVGKKSFFYPPCRIIDPKKDYTATLKTSMGTITIKLLPKVAPETVNNFVFLAQQKFYDGSIFHRVIPEFMIQGGDAAKRDGTGDAGYKFEDEFDPKVTFSKPGLLAMANSGPGTNGSQFFITEATPTHLNGKHTIFGEVLEGLDVVKAIARVPRDEAAGDRPKKDVVLQTVTIKES
jgi:peptidyl-prolyl cis-trans isomerase A (cyclophilin A)